MDTENRKTVGVEISDQLHEYIVLTAFYLDTTKSQVIRNALEQYTEKGTSQDKLLTEIKHDLQVEWNKQKLQSSGNVANRFRLFKKMKKEELQKNGVSNETIKLVLDINK